MTPPTASANVCLRPATAADVKALYRLYVQPGERPFFVDFAEATEAFSQAQFKTYCSRDNRTLWILTESEQLAGFFLFLDIQPECELADVDIGFLSAVPAPEPAIVSRLADVLRLASRHQGLTRLQLAVSATDPEKLALAEALGFQREGVLRQQLFRNGGLLDLVMLARMEGRAS